MRPRKPSVPAPIKATVDQACKVSYDLMTLVETAVSWPCVREEVMTWAMGCRADNTGWSEYEFAQRVIQAIHAAAAARRT